MGGIISRWWLGIEEEEEEEEGEEGGEEGEEGEEEEEEASEQDPDETDTPPGPHPPATGLPLRPHLQDEGTCQGAYKIEYMC